MHPGSQHYTVHCVVILSKSWAAIRRGGRDRRRWPLPHRKIMCSLKGGYAYFKGVSSWMHKSNGQDLLKAKINLLPQSERSPVQFSGRAHAWVAGQSLVRVHSRSNWYLSHNRCFSPSLSPSLPFSLKKNKENKKERERRSYGSGTCLPTMTCLIRNVFSDHPVMFTSHRTHFHPQCEILTGLREDSVISAYSVSSFLS